MKLPSFLPKKPATQPYGATAGAVAKAPKPKPEDLIERVRLAQKKPIYTNATAAVQDKSLAPIDVIAPQEVELSFDFIKIGNVYLRTLFVSGYPRFVAPGWLEPIINFDHSLDISFYIFPVQGKSVLDDLRRKIAEMEAEISTDIERGKIVNPSTQAKLDDALVLQEQLVKGIERFFEFSFYITIPAASEEELNTLTKRVESTLGSLLIVGKHASLDMNKGFLSTVPFGIDRLAITRNMDTTSLATTFPFTTAELSGDTGILYGINSQNESFIIFDRFSLENSNMAIFATSGAGKCQTYNTSVMFKEKDGKIRLSSIGATINSLFKKQPIVKLDSESEGVLNPNLQVFTFDKNLKGQWSDVEVASRKISPEEIYQIKTKSGREVSVTKDHSLVVLKNGKINTTHGENLELGDYLPLPRFIDVGNKESTDQHLLTLLGLIISEGCVSHDFVRIYNTDPQILETIRLSIEKCGYNYTLLTEKDGYRVRPGPKFAKYVKRLGAHGNSATKRVPPFLFDLNNTDVAIFLKAYFEGDGGVENHEITATTKSKNLASDLSYLLLRFGVITRMNIKRKAATNTVNKIKRNYYRIIISGQDNIAKFTNNIGFLTERKNAKARALLKKGNTNVDVIPEIGIVLKEIYSELYNSELPAPKKFSEIKLGIFKPSPSELLKMVGRIEKRIKQIEALETDGLSTLRSLPTLQNILEKGKDKNINRLLWKKIGKSWHIMKNSTPPYLYNTLQAASVTHNYEYSHSYVGGAIYRSFKHTGESLRQYDKSLWESVVVGKQNPQYDRVIKARDYISEKYNQKQEVLKKVKEKLAWLKTLATADLFWDPIIKIKKFKTKHKYVYDLQVENQVFLAGHGGMFVHNSFFVKLECLRSLMLGTEILIIDPENEYKNLSEAVGGQYINFSYSSPSKINPFDLAQVYEPGENQLGLKILGLHSLFKVIMGEITPAQEALLDNAIIAAYRAKGITSDPETQSKEPPLMEDLYKALIGKETDEALDLAARLEKYVKGSYVGIFDQQTNVNLNNPFVVFCIRDLQDALRPIAMFIILDFIWTKVRKDIKRRILVVDEAWHMMRYQDTAQFMFSIVKRARKYYLGLTTITQDVQDFLSQDIGKAVVTNSALRVLLKQSPAAIDRVSEVFYLSQGERQLLLAAGLGEGILFAGPHHAPIRVVASEDEYKFVTTKPQDTQSTEKKEELAPITIAAIAEANQK